MSDCGCGGEGIFFNEGNTFKEKLDEVFSSARADIYEYHSGECSEKMIKQLEDFKRVVDMKIAELQEIPNEGFCFTDISLSKRTSQNQRDVFFLHFAILFSRPGHSKTFSKPGL